MTGPRLYQAVLVLWLAFGLVAALMALATSRARIGRAVLLVAAGPLGLVWFLVAITDGAELPPPDPAPEAAKNIVREPKQARTWAAS